MCTLRLRPSPTDVRTPHLRAITHTIASLVTLIYKCKHPTQVSLHLYTHSYSREHRLPQCFKHVENLLSSTQTPQIRTHRRFLMDKGRQGCLHCNVSERYKYLFLSRHQGTHKQPNPANGISLPLYPAFQSFTSIALRKAFRVKSFSLNPNLLHEEHNCNVKAGEVCAFTHRCAHTYACTLKYSNDHRQTT